MKGIGGEDDGLYVFYSECASTTNSHVPIATAANDKCSVLRTLSTVNTTKNDEIMDVAPRNKRLENVPVKHFEEYECIPKL